MDPVTRMYKNIQYETIRSLIILADTETLKRGCANWSLEETDTGAIDILFFEHSEGRYNPEVSLHSRTTLKF